MNKLSEFRNEINKHIENELIKNGNLSNADFSAKMLEFEKQLYSFYYLH